MSDKQQAFDFEQSLAELTSLVQRMESGELTLEQSLGAFEQGIRLTRSCQQALAEAEQKVTLLTEQNGQSLAQPMVRDAFE
ncbi:MULTISPECIES: exodeoxyribonuclease VII small subunit [unclassified Oceanobacter]|jgi:exodeoxyribonuclease VII small subunit|uniref:exodeoxyribonuclease VII small subunit n=1 Tax=unclassified Oceanobacter TaxID=2620260 RepID=UPI0026E3DF9D|nr:MULTISPECIES: exodeoxyribonuclease VII small subunit [unclassified Oceanobacter]MDO6805030.1 exodeoxyribonuclease VII small subunit [Wenyingzhuangia sp. 1_MG-2023]MDO6682840.1 exodeoxyribonuclease VII small subunit [Oceanobacter sp. 5_MG-2023]MDP2505599.1 exodeoxyribonuclease VII small subunit [Oceanobacter sp. 3_MG-2023]MDP2547181.1 exodeoxyribonuclease VII small subunit [Oceanobacter sp. 4_MG-2023]MDP2609400.1 exodeoxyribonuclease VII small subunit [Oceanobacter sp. 1_MG-2023]